MKKYFQEAGNNYTARAITEEDWKSYKNFYQTLSRAGFLIDRLYDPDMTLKESWQELKNSYEVFGLWDGNTLIGSTIIDFDEIDNKTTAIFSHDEISDDYQKLGLSSYLYDVRMKYLEDIGFKGPTIAYIDRRNSPSINAARRNGFTETGTGGGDLIFTYQGFSSLEDRPSYRQL